MQYFKQTSKSYFFVIHVLLLKKIEAVLFFLFHFFNVFLRTKIDVAFPHAFIFSSIDVSLDDEKAGRRISAKTSFLLLVHAEQEEVAGKRAKIQSGCIYWWSLTEERNFDFYFLGAKNIHSLNLLKVYRKNCELEGWWGSIRIVP